MSSTASAQVMLWQVYGNRHHERAAVKNQSALEVFFTVLCRCPIRTVETGRTRGPGRHVESIARNSDNNMANEAAKRSGAVLAMAFVI
jgi:hypothetical protein